MKILIVGASGLVGNNLYRSALEAGYEVLGTHRGDPVETLRTLDLADVEAMESLVSKFNPEAVLCCAAWPWVDGCESDPERARRENALQPAGLARAAHRIGARFVYFSTSYVFNGVDGPYDENASPSPINSYGWSKLEGEQRCLDATEGNAIIARTMGVFGQEPQRKNFVCQVHDQLSAGRGMKVPIDQYGNATHALDVSRATLSLIQKGESGIWNLAGPDPYLCRRDFALHICNLCHLDPSLFSFFTTEELAQSAARPRQGGLIIKRMQQELGIDPVELSMSDLSWIKIKR